MYEKLMFLLIPLSICYFSSVFAVEPENLSVARQQVIKYYESGEYGYDVNKVALLAQHYIEQRVVANKSKRKLAIVLDVDDTAISNFVLKKADGFCAASACADHIMHLVRKAPIPAILKLYNFAKSRGVSTFFITARKHRLFVITSNLLHRSGYRNWTKLYLLPKNFTGDDFLAFKINARKKIINQGYDIILNIGDHYQDLTGGYADMTLKVPNPCY